MRLALSGFTEMPWIREFVRREVWIEIVGTKSGSRTRVWRKMKMSELGFPGVRMKERYKYLLGQTNNREIDSKITEIIF